MPSVPTVPLCLLFLSSNCSTVPTVLLCPLLLCSHCSCAHCFFVPTFPLCPLFLCAHCSSVLTVPVCSRHISEPIFHHLHFDHASCAMLTRPNKAKNSCPWLLAFARYIYPFLATGSYPLYHCRLSAHACVKTILRTMSAIRGIA